MGVVVDMAAWREHRQLGLALATRHPSTRRADITPCHDHGTRYIPGLTSCPHCPKKDPA